VTAWRREVAPHFALLALGAALRLWQYGAGASQWVDELALSRGILGLSWHALLTGPLPFAQVAPPGFVLLERAVAATLGTSDAVLRLLPLAGSLAALWLFYRLALRLLAGPGAVSLALALFAVQPSLIHFAAQVKPYSTDLAVALALTLLAAGLVEHPNGGPAPRRAMLAGLAAAPAVFLSHAAALALAGIGATLALAAVAEAIAANGRRGPAEPANRVEPPKLAEPANRARSLAIPAGLWLLCAGIAATAARRGMAPAVHDYLAHVWTPAFGPRPHSLSGDARWLATAIGGELGGGGLGYPWVPLYAALAALGTVALWHRRPRLAPLVVAPAVVALAAADLHLYPFAGRLVLFVLPVLILLIASGAEALAGMIRLPGGGRRGAAPAAAGVTVVYLVALLPALWSFFANPPVYRLEETTPLLRAVAARRQPGDAIYVYYGAGQALRFYGPRYGLGPSDYLLGGCHRGDTRAYLGELDRFRGRVRLWVLIAHAQPWLGEEQTLLAYLDRLGTRRLALRVLPHAQGAGLPAEAYLYDLAAARRARAVAAETFSITPPAAPPDPRFACTGPQNAVP
jgi:hypothetical protein